MTGAPMTSDPAAALQLLVAAEKELLLLRARPDATPEQIGQARASVRAAGESG